LVDAVFHVEVEWREVYRDGEVVHVDAADLEDVALLQLGSDVQVFGHGFPKVRLFDFLISFDGVEVAGRLTVSDIHRMQRDARAGNRPCPVKLRRLPFGKQNRIPAGERGWVYLERFLTMVKGAMVDEEDFGKVCFSNSPAALEQIRDGSALLREAAQQGADQLKEVLDTFFNALQHKHFSAASTDGTLFDGKREVAQNDRQVVAHVMEQMVGVLSSEWEKQGCYQRQRQLELAVNRSDVDRVRHLLAARVSPNERGEGGQSLLHVSARFRDVAIIKVLIESNADVACQDDRGNCPAHTLPLFAIPETVQLFDLLSPAPVLCLQNEAGVTVARRFASWALTAQNNQPYPLAQARVEELSLCTPKPFSMRVAARLPSSQNVFGVTRDICAVRCGCKEFFVHTWESSANARVHMLYLTGSPGLPWSMQEPAVAEVVSEWCSRHSLKVFVVTHRSVPVASQMSLQEFQDGVLCIIRQLPLKDRFVLFDNMQMLAGLSWKLQDRVMALLISNLGNFFSDEFLMSRAWTRQRSNLAQMADMFLERDAAMVHSTLLNVFVYGGLRCNVWENLRHEHQAATQQGDDQFWAFGAAFMAWPLHFTETLAGCSQMRHLPATLICGDNSPAGSTQEATRLFQRRFMPWAPIRFVADSKVWWELEGSSQRNCVGVFLDDLLDNMSGS